MKYMGSKSRIAKYIVPIIQNEIDKNNATMYIEPFCGGCNVIDKIKCKRRIAYDKNPYLIALLKGVTQKDGDTMLYPYIDRDLYCDVRANMEDGFDDFTIGMVGFLASYNGRFFDGGYAGVVTTKTGVVRDYYDEAKRNLEAQIPLLIGVEFSTNDYRSLEPQNMKNAVIYCDPPYKNTKQYGTSKNFDHDAFWETMREWSKHATVLISEQTAPSDFECIWEAPVKRTIDNNKRVETTERLFRYCE